MHGTDAIAKSRSARKMAFAAGSLAATSLACVWMYMSHQLGVFGTARM